MRGTARRATIGRHRATASPNGGFTPLATININQNPVTKAHIEVAKTAGASCIRTEEHVAGTPTLKTIAQYCVEVGVKLCWITGLIVPGETNETTNKNLLEQIAELNAEQKAVVVLIEHDNELWPGGLYGNTVVEYPVHGGPKNGVTVKVTGKNLATWYVEIAKELVTASVTIPFGIEVQTSSNANIKAWMEEVLSVNTAELKTALIGTGSEAKPNNRLVSHPYFGKMTIPLVEPNNLYAYKTATPANGSKEWGSQRWMQQQQLIKEKTGLKVPVAITEHGARQGGTEIALQENNVLTNAEKVEYIEAFWAFVKTVAKGEVAIGTEAPSALGEPILALACWYDLYLQSGAETETKHETYGIVTSTGTPEEASSIYKKWKEGALAV